MEILEGTRIADRVEGLIHEETQVHDDFVDLTVSNISFTTAVGHLDFGGGELELPEPTPHPTSKRDPDDEYGWWDLEAGIYRLDYNERVDVPEDGLAIITPRSELLESFCHHATVFGTRMEELRHSLLSVGPQGLRLKENARTSRIYVLV